MHPRLGARAEGVCSEKPEIRDTISREQSQGLSEGRFQLVL